MIIGITINKMNISTGPRRSPFVPPHLGSPHIESAVADSPLFLSGDAALASLGRGRVLLPIDAAVRKGA